jgi:hypothetical protein
MRRRGGLIAVLATLSWTAGCMMAGSEPMPEAGAFHVEDRGEADAAQFAPAAPPASAAPMERQMAMDGVSDEGEGRDLKKDTSSRRARGEPKGDEADKEEGKAIGGEGEAEGRTRSWFPEAFLWQPEVVTDSAGTASLEVVVPDQLTSWRVLALAHDARGQQAGAVHQFEGTLPLYVDPVVPGWLYAGDRVVLPVQAVNTTTASVSATVTVEASGAMSGSGTASLVLAPAGSDVRTLAFDVLGAGEAKITARLVSDGAQDAAERTIPVLAAGRPVETQRGGTLGSARSFVLAAPAGAEAQTEQVEVLVFPGALSVLQLELERLASGARPVDAGYGFALTGAVSRLSEAAQVELDEATLRKLRLLSWQRVVPAARAPTPGASADLLASLGQVREHAQAAELVTRLQRTLKEGQRADGTWARTERSTLQQVLVDTAYCARVLPEDQAGPRLRASAALERYLHEVTDPYTAAVLLASGLLEADSAQSLQERLTDAIVLGQDGAPSLSVPAGVTNPWGQTPSQAELLAWAVLALPADHAQRGDFAAQLMQTWSASQGFGAGHADTLALDAVTQALGGLSGPVEVSLDIGGVVVATATLDPRQPKVPARLQGAPQGDAPITVSTSASTPGLAFVATRRSYVPWSEADRLPGVELTVESTGLAVGREAALSLTAVAPSGASLRIEQPLPSGVLVGEDAAQRVAAVGGTLQVLTDRVVITTRPFEPGEILSLSLPVTPAFAGRFQTAPLRISADGGGSVPMRPMLWQVGGEGS